MIFHKRILEWQAAHPNITWVGWGIVWLMILALLFRLQTSAPMTTAESIS
ncbi:MAG TPA: hypothetical protein VMY41_18560 [Thermohalobaculum sp.]|nr:hypothetical protein [Thermohalobaculum sp.]